MNLQKDSQSKQLKHVHEKCQINAHYLKKKEILKNKYKTEIALIEEKIDKLDEEMKQMSSSC